MISNDGGGSGKLYLRHFKSIHNLSNAPLAELKMKPFLVFIET